MRITMTLGRILMVIIIVMHITVGSRSYLLLCRALKDFIEFTAV
jgi:hypothetical protein